MNDIITILACIIAIVALMISATISRRQAKYWHNEANYWHQRCLQMKEDKTRGYATPDVPDAGESSRQD